MTPPFGVTQQKDFYIGKFPTHKQKPGASASAWFSVNCLNIKNQAGNNFSRHNVLRAILFQLQPYLHDRIHLSQRRERFSNRKF